MSALLATLTNVAVFAQAGVDTPNPGGAPTAPTVGGRIASSATTLTTPDVAWRALAPLIILGVGAVLLITISSLVRAKLPKSFFSLFTVAVAGLAFASTVPLWARVQGWDHLLWWNLDTGTTGPFSTLGSSCASLGPSCGAVGIDGFSLAITMVICASIILGALFSADYLQREGLDGPELYVLMLLSGAGGIVMAVANDLIIVFLGLETLSIAVYVLVAMHRKRVQSQEAGLKYFVLGGFSSAFFLYGVAMVYGATATTNVVKIKTLFATGIAAPLPTNDIGPFTPGWHLNSPLLLLGLGLMLVGLGFKVAAVPFHFWSPDAYDGAPTPVTGFMAAAVKAAAFAALVRIFAVGFQTYSSDWRPVIAALAALSMVVGSLLAIVQTNVKRTLAYSSISHAGFILMALQASSTGGNQAILFYLITYMFMVAGSFGIVMIVARKGDGRTTLDDYRGLGSTNPGLALLFTIFLLSQAGVPFTSGFVAKLYTVIAAIDGGATWLAIIGMVSSVVATYLYLRIIVSMYMSGSVEDGTMPPATRASRLKIPFGAGLALAVCLLVTIGAGIFPGPLTDFTGNGTSVLVNVAEPPAVAPAGTGLGVAPQGSDPQSSGQGAGATGATDTGTQQPAEAPTPSAP